MMPRALRLAVATPILSKVRFRQSQLLRLLLVEIVAATATAATVAVEVLQVLVMVAEECLTCSILRAARR